MNFMQIKSKMKYRNVLMLLKSIKINEVAYQMILNKQKMR
nr:MAG TPA: hypothetical protein [Bacteriophage sp.]